MRNDHLWTAISDNANTLPITINTKSESATNNENEYPARGQIRYNKPPRKHQSLRKFQYIPE